MATTLVTITGDVTDMLAGDFDYRRTKVYLKHNTDYVVDPDDGTIRLGSATLSINSDGTFTLTDVIASVDTVENLQATIYVDYADPATRNRKTQAFGPYDLSGETGTVDLTELEEVQALPATAISQATASLEALVAEGETVRDETQAIRDGIIGDLGTTDSQTATLVNGPSLTSAALSASFAQVIGVPADATAAEINALIAGAPSGSQIWFKPAVMGPFSEDIVVDNSVHLIGWWGLIDTFLDGTRLDFTDGHGIVITEDYATVTGIAVYNTDADFAVGSNGFHVYGTSDNFTHGVKLNKCTAAGYESSLRHGSYSDHTTSQGSKWGGMCTYAVTFDENVHHDFCHIDDVLAAVGTASLHLVADTSVVNVSLIRCHLGFGPYGILQDGTDTGYGFYGLHLIDSPIELVTEQHVKLRHASHVTINGGGYWIWNGTPAKAAFEVDSIDAGRVRIAVPLALPDNPNSPAVVQINDHTSSPVHIDTTVGTWAQAACINPSPQVDVFIDGEVVLQQSALTFQNGWSDFSDSSPTFAPARVVRAGRMAYLTGNLTAGTTTSGTGMFQIPAEFRPAEIESITCWANEGDIGEIRITPEGYGVWNGPDPGGAFRVAMNGFWPLP